jgi:glycosyltransferase involved in cell wall biosynthesis
LIGEFTSGGAETLVVKVTNRLIENGWNVIVSARKDGPLSEQLIDRDLLYLLPKTGTIDFGYLRALIKLIRRHDIDIVHSHLFGNDLYGFLAAKYTGKRILQTIHGMDSISSKKKIIAYKLMAPFVDMVVTVSDSLKEEFLKVVKINRQKIMTIDNGVDVEKRPTGDPIALKKELGINGADPIIGAVGNVKVVKGYDTLISAMPSILKKYRNAMFVIVGDITEQPDYKAKLDRQVEELELKDKILFLGYRSDAYDVLSLFDIYTLPSRSEGLSVALLEAMSLSKPIVATTVGGNSLVLKDKETALLVRSEDPKMLSSCILHYLDNKAVAECTGKSAYDTVEAKYSMKQMIDQYEELYRELLA